MQIRRANLGQKIKCPSNLRVDIDFQTRFGSSIGLALRLFQRCPTNIDLLPVERKEARDFRKEKFWLISAGLLIAMIPVTIAYNIWFQATTLKKEVIFLNSLLSEYENVNKNIANLKEDIMTGEAKLKPFESLAVKKSLSLEAIFEIRKLLPDDIWLTSISKDRDLFLLEGRTASSLLTINEFKNRLASSSLFDSVEIIYASLPRETEEGAGQYRDFSIKFKLKSPGETPAAPKSEKSEKSETKGKK
jgi:Tfp pilus assembly protein PilN